LLHISNIINAVKQGIISLSLSLSLLQDAIFRVVAAILHLGNIDFAKGEESDSAIVEDEESKFHLQITADLLMCDQSFAIIIIRYFLFFCMCCICWSCPFLRCDPHALEDALCKRVMITPEEIIKKTLDPHGATVSRDGFARTIYSHLFNW
jgi:myosin-5